MALLYRLFRPLLFLFDAERAHALAGLALRLLARLFPRPALAARGALAQTICGVTFPNPVGLAAGMDKGEVLAPAYFRLGFGFVEIGTITPRPQSGNPLPRLFRLIDRRAIINRMGFNNAGAAAVAERLKALPKQPGPIGLNLGKNKDTPNETAADDYVAAFRALATYADYVAINVSSPNTPGLRALQGQIGALVTAIAKERDRLTRRVPIFVKISPDESGEAIDAFCDSAIAAGADGLIATNTTVDHEGEQGGLSGEPLKEKALRVCARIYSRTKGRVPIIGVGGISSAEDAYQRIRAGASLIQIYTGLIYRGPALANEICDGLTDFLKRDGLTLSEARGRDHESLLS